VAIEGFGKVGGGVAREVTRRGGRVVAVSTVAGCLADPSGVDVDLGRTTATIVITVTVAGKEKLRISTAS
jgi:glutamate dehydrogenase/leucine dehydrogenase